MEPDSEEMRRILVPGGRRWARWREKMMDGGAMELVAGEGWSQWAVGFGGCMGGLFGELGKEATDCTS